MKYILLAISMIILTSCGDFKEIKTSAKIVEVGQCENATADAFYGKHCGRCKVKLDTGDFISKCGPVMIGETVNIIKDFYRNDPQSEWKYQRTYYR